MYKQLIYLYYTLGSATKAIYYTYQSRLITHRNLNLSNYLLFRTAPENFCERFLSLILSVDVNAGSSCREASIKEDGMSAKEVSISSVVSC